MVPFGFPWEALAALRAQGLPLPVEFVREAAAWHERRAAMTAAALDDLRGSADHLVPERVRAVELGVDGARLASGRPLAPQATPAKPHTEWWRVPAIVRMPEQPIRDVDGTPIQLGDHVLYAGTWRLQRGVVVRLRERGIPTHAPIARGTGMLDFVPELHVRLDGQRQVVRLYYPNNVVVLKRARRNPRRAKA